MKISLEELDRLNEEAYLDRYAERSTTLKIGQSVLEKSFKNGYDKGMAYARLNIAIARFLHSRNREAIESVTQSLFWFSENSSEPGYARALSLQGNIHESFGDYEKALELCLKSLKLCTQNGDKETEAETTAVLGLIYTRLCNFNKALEYYTQSLGLREELGDENGMASSLNRIGMIHRMTKQYDEALSTYFKSLKIREKNKLKSAIPWTMLGIASTYEDMGNDNYALQYYKKGIDGKDPRLLLQCLIGTGRVYSRRGWSEKAEQELLQSLEKAEELQALPLIPEIWSALAQHYELNKQLDKALSALRKFQATKERVLNEDALNRVRNLEIANAIEKAEIEKELFRLRHVELKAAFDLIEEKNREITSSITYASRIQRAILPDISEIPFIESNCFIFYLPRDIVSGDFYWFSEIADKLVVVAADCTGHGVPGALMSMLGASLLDEIVNRKGILDAGPILDELRHEVIRSLRQVGKENMTRDGMDISLLIYDKKETLIRFAGAFNNLCLVRGKEIQEYKADRMPIGVHDFSVEKFNTLEIKVEKADMVYLCSDGFEDQFGGQDGKKFRRKALLNLFLDIHSRPVKKQKDILEKKFLEWKGKLPQVDDVLVIGMKI